MKANLNQKNNEKNTAEKDHTVTERIIETLIPPEHAGARLDSYLSKRFDYLSRNQWQKSIKKGEILLNNQKTKGSRTLQAGDIIRYSVEYTEPTVEMKYSIVFEDEYLIVVDKGGNLPCHPAGPFFKNTLWYDLEQRYGKNSIFLVNRLDRETSGLMLLAKSSKVAKIMSEKFKTRDVDKRYLTIVHGQFSQEINAEGYLFNDKKSEVRKKRCFSYAKPTNDNEDYETSKTIFYPRHATTEFSLLEAKLYTGRMHQIRASLYSLGYPLVGDKLYGLNDQFFLRFANGNLSFNDREALILERQALHSWQLKFNHPVTKEQLSFIAPLPEEMASFCSKNNLK